MEGLIEFIYLIVIAIGMVIIWCIYRAIKLIIIKYKYQSAIKIFHSYGYRYYSYYNYKGKGFIYRNQLDSTTLDSLLLRYGYEPLVLNTQFKVFDTVAIIDYPEWEERYDNIGAIHGGLRLLHFYMLEVQDGNKVYQRPFHHYLDNDMAGEPIYESAYNNPDIIDSMISSDIRFILQKFYDDEVRYWEHELLKRTKNK